MITKSKTFDNGARIGYQNLISSTSITGDASATVDLATIANTYERWRPDNTATTARFVLSSNADVDFIAIGAHNLSGQEIEIGYATTVGGGITTLQTITPTSNDPIMITFDAMDIREVTIVATFASDREIGYVATGICLKMPYPIYGGHTPAELSPNTEYQNNVSESGQFLGRNIVRQGVETNYAFRNLDPDFVRGDFKAFIESARTAPFFLQWRPDLYPDEVVFGFTTSDIIVTNSGGGIRLMNTTISVRGHRDI